MKKLHLLIATIFFLNINNSFSQIKKESENISDSLKVYNTLILSEPTDPYNYYKQACFLTKIDSNDLAINSILKSIKNNIKFEYILADSDFDNLRNDEEWTKIDSAIIHTLEVRDSVKEKEYAYLLIKAGVLDQKFRTLRRFYKLENYPKNYDHQVDSTLNILKDSVSTKGWPLYSQVGKQAAKYAFLVFQHAGQKEMKKVLPLIVNACKINEADPKTAAMMIDRILMNKLQAQIYGTQVVSYDRENWKFHKIASENKVNERRIAIGLSTIESYAEHMKVNYIPIKERKDYKNIKIKKSWNRKGYIL